MKKIKYIALIIAGLTMLLSSCEDSNKNSSIPDFPVYMERNINMEAASLRTPGGFTVDTIPQSGDALGYGGILIFNSFEEQLFAFDLACPNEKDMSVRVVPDGAGFCTCTKCGSKFNVGYGIGNCIAGPAKEGLKKYTISTYYNGGIEIVRVTR